MMAAVQQGVPFLISPCCIGKVLKKTKNTVNHNNMLPYSDTDPESMVFTNRPLEAAATRNPASTRVILYPRSHWLKQQAQVDLEAYALLAAAADYGGSGGNAQDEEIATKARDDTDETIPSNSNTDTSSPAVRDELARRHRCRRAKVWVEQDRLQWAREQGYHVRLLELPRLGPIYAKRELLVGAPQDSPAAQHMDTIPTSPLT